MRPGDIVYIRAIYRRPIEGENEGHQVAPVQRDGTPVSADRLLKTGETLCVNVHTIVTRSDLEVFAIQMADRGQGGTGGSVPQGSVPGAAVAEADDGAATGRVPGGGDQRGPAGGEPAKPW
jgi:hypothetical protein